MAAKTTAKSLPRCCAQCRQHIVIPDRDPTDWFNDDDCAVVCSCLYNPKPQARARRVADRSRYRVVGSMLRPYEVKSVPRPAWCPLGAKEFKSLRNRFFTVGRSFREAHHIVGEIVGLAEETGLKLDEFVRRHISACVADDVFNLKNAMTKRNIIDISGPVEFTRPPRPHRWNYLKIL